MPPLRGGRKRRGFNRQPEQLPEILNLGLLDEAMGFEFDWLRASGGGYTLEWITNGAGTVLLLLYLVLSLFLVRSRRGDFRSFKPWQGGLFVLALALLYPLAYVAVLSRYELMPILVPSSAFLPRAPSLPLLSLFLLTVMATWWGPLAGFWAGLGLGLVQALFVPMVLTDLFPYALGGWVLGFCIHQPYKGTLFKALRRPLIAVLLFSSTLLLISSLNRLVEAIPPGGLLAADYAFSFIQNQLPLWGAFSLGGGLVLEISFLFRGLRPPQRADQPSIYDRSLRYRFMVTVIPLILLGIVLSVLAVTQRAISVAQQQALDEMDRLASNAATTLVDTFISGRNLLQTFASDQNLLDPDRRHEVLALGFNVVPFFQELLLTDAQGQVVDAVRETADLQLVSEEKEAVQQALAYEVDTITHLSPFIDGYHITFVWPVVGPEGVAGALLGRVNLASNPNFQNLLASLQYAWGAGSGFICDDRNLIVAHPLSQQILRSWSPNPNPTRILEQDEGRGILVYEDMAADGYRQITYVKRVEGLNPPLTIVLQLPFTNVLETASTIASQLLMVQLVIGIILLVIIPLLISRITRPLSVLSQAAFQIAQGNLNAPITLAGDDEVAELGRTFEHMRVGLRDRLRDLSLLLRISQTVSATLELEQGVLPILEGAIEDTGATMARFVLLGEQEAASPARVFSAGLDDPAFAALDQVFISILRRNREPLILHDLREAAGALPKVPYLRSAAAFAVRAQNRTTAVLWVGSDEVGGFDTARVNFLNTLANQAGILVENARLFQAAEGGRRRLAAILASTADAILVTDQNHRLLLINPAAQRLLGVDEANYGRPLEDLTMPVTLKQALLSTEADQGTQTVEVAFADNRIFSAGLAPIYTAEGRMLGKVAVLRDVTHFKELDEMKSDFVATVSHDLRAPLTFIRGYATMLTMVGELNDRQSQYVERILEGIDQMSALISDLLNLRRIEAGVGIRQEPCRLGLILVEAVDAMRARAAGKGLTLRLDSAEGSPLVIGDRTLLRQAISNLVDNAIKYTPAGGQVKVGVRVSPPEAIVYVSDTGIGISLEDQARLFEKFHRIKRRETADIPGTGLGLALVKSIVERMKGRIWVESELNRGSTFYIALPLAPEEDGAPESHGHGESAG